MLETLRYILTMVMGFLTALIVIELILTVPYTVKMFKLIKRLNEIVEISAFLITSGIDETLNDSEKITIKSPDGNFIIRKHENDTEIDGVKFNFQRDLLEQIGPTLELLVNSIYTNARYLLFKDIMLKQCKKIENSTKQLQKAIAEKDVRGANE